MDAAFWARRGDASGSSGASEIGGGQSPFVGVGAGGGKREFDPPRAHFHERADLEQLQPDRAGGGVGELGVAETDAAHGADENISK